MASRKKVLYKSSIQTDNKLLHERQWCQSQEWYGCKCDYVGYDVYYSGRCFREELKEKQATAAMIIGIRVPIITKTL